MSTDLDWTHVRAFALVAFSVRCDDHVAAWQLVLVGWGIGFMSREIGDPEPRAVAMLGGRTVDVLPMWLTAHAELRTSARIRRVYDWLADGLARPRAAP